MLVNKITLNILHGVGKIEQFATLGGQLEFSNIVQKFPTRTKTFKLLYFSNNKLLFKGRDARTENFR